MNNATAIRLPLPSFDPSCFEQSERVKPLINKTITPYNGKLPEFRNITQAQMPMIWEYLKNAPGRTTDFSYGGVLMWVDYFNYQYAIVEDTLFIKGTLEDNLSVPAFALPVGKMPLSESLGVVLAYCRKEGIPMEFSAIPEASAEEFQSFGATLLPLEDWGDYLYDAEKLATLSGKKMNKKRNHVNKFKNLYTDWELLSLHPGNCRDAMEFMDKFDLEGDDTEMARQERRLTRELIRCVANGDNNLIGGILYADGKVAAFTIADIKGDTLFIHVEKATREIEGSYEMINHEFARRMCEKFPGIKYINREDDAGDQGLRRAKESYHPIEILKKFNVVF